MVGPSLERAGWGARLLGVPVTPEIAAISLVYFVQGVLGLSRLATSFFLKVGADAVALIPYPAWLPRHAFASAGLLSGRPPF